MIWTWVQGATVGRQCPLCALSESHAVVLQYHAPYRDWPLRRLLRCRGCGSMFLDDLSDPPHVADSPEVVHHTNFYLEVGAGIDSMTELFYATDVSWVREYLEIGCGFGLSLDFARRTFHWRVAGIDPGPIAMAGARMLDVDIRDDYVVPGYDFGGRRFDLVMCSEVVEHVTDPIPFLTAVQQAVSADGVLMLTTPNADHVRADTPPGVLVPILQPGFHLVLFTAASLDTALRAAGFSHVEVWEHGASLRAVAASRPVAVNREPRTDPHDYRRYLEASIAAEPPSPFTVGMAYRLLRHAAANDDDASEIDHAFAQVREQIEKVYGLDVGRPEALDLDRLPPLQFNDVNAHMPFCMGPVLAARGTALERAGRPGEAVAFLQAGAAAALAVRRALHATGFDDGDCETAWRHARLRLPVAMCDVDPDRAVALLDEVAAPAPPGVPPALWALPPVLLRHARREVFVRLVGLGHYRPAAAMLRAVAEDFGADVHDPHARRSAVRRARGAIRRMRARLRAITGVGRQGRWSLRWGPGPSALIALYDRAVGAADGVDARAVPVPFEPEREHVECPAEPLAGHVRLHRRLAYRIVARRARWQGIDVRLGTHRRPASGELHVAVGSRGRQIRTTRLELDGVRDNDWVRCEFPPIADSAGRAFRVTFTLVGPGEDTAVSLYETVAAEAGIRSRLLHRLGMRPTRGSLYCCLRYGREAGT
jgi:SAM-dependent methyltransferase